MSLKLPKLCFHVLHVTVACLNIQLIERCVNWNAFYLTVSLEVGFKAHVEVLSDGLLDSVPESDFLYQVVA